MNRFVLSLATRIAADESVPALRSAAEILRRDMAAVLTGGGPENAIVLARDEALGSQAWRMEVAEDAITLYHRDALGGVYGLLRGVITLYVLFLLVPVIRTIIPVDLLTRYLGQSALSAIFTSDGFFARIVTGV